MESEESAPNSQHEDLAKKWFDEITSEREALKEHQREIQEEQREAHQQEFNTLVSKLKPGLGNFLSANSNHIRSKMEEDIIAEEKNMKPSKSSGRVVFDRQQSASLIEAFTIYEDSLDFKNALIVCFRGYGFDLLRYTNSTDDTLGVYNQDGMSGDVLVISW